MEALPILLMTGISAGGSLLGGIQESRSLKFKAREAETQARLENLRAKERANLIRTQLNADLASANATFAGRGIVTTSGSALLAREESSKAASRDIETALFGGRAEASQLQSQADQFRSGAKSARVAGVIGAATAVGRGAFSLIKPRAE